MPILLGTGRKKPTKHSEFPLGLWGQASSHLMQQIQLRCSVFLVFFFSQSWDNKRRLSKSHRFCWELRLYALSYFEILVLGIIPRPLFHRLIMNCWANLNICSIQLFLLFRIPIESSKMLNIKLNFLNIQFWLECPAHWSNSLMLEFALDSNRQQTNNNKTENTNLNILPSPNHDNMQHILQIV